MYVCYEVDLIRNSVAEVCDGPLMFPFLFQGNHHSCRDLNIAGIYIAGSAVSYFDELSYRHEDYSLYWEYIALSI